MASQSFVVNYPGGVAGYKQLKLNIYTIETNISGNWTKERADLWMVVNNASGGYFNNFNHNSFVGIGGNDFTKTNTTFDARTTGDKLLIGSWDTIVYHESDGSKTISVSAWHNTQTGLGNASLSSTYVCDTIPRYANVTITTNIRTINTLSYNYSVSAPIDHKQYRLNGGAWINDGGSNTITGLQPNTQYNIQVRVKRTDSQLWSESNVITMTTYDIARFTSLSNVNIGANIPVNITNPSGASVSLEIKNSSKNTTFISRSGLSNTNNITPNSTETNNIYAATSSGNTLPVIYVLTTTQNGVSYSIDSSVYNMYVTNANPIFSNYTYQDTNSITIALTGNNQILINGQSNVKTTITVPNRALPQKSATMINYNTIIGSGQISANYSSSNTVEMTINSVTSGSIMVNAIDSRGNVTGVPKTATLLPYTNVLIQSMELLRENGVSTTARITGKGTYINQNFGAQTNTITSIQYRKKEKSSSTWGSWVNITNLFVISNGNFQNVSVANTISGFTFGTEYDVEIRATDRLTSVTYATELNSGEIIMAKNKTKKIVGIGKIPDNNLPGGSLDVGGNFNVDGNSYVGVDLNVLRDLIVSRNTDILGTLQIRSDLKTNAYGSVQEFIKIFGGDANGQGIGIGSGAAMLIGSGESRAAVLPNISATDETMFVTSDNTIRFITNLQNGWANRKEVSIGTDGSITIDGKTLLNRTYPVGAIYQSTYSTSPATLFGGTWVQLTDRFLVGAGSTYTNGSTGGASTVTLTKAQLPNITLSVFGGSGQTGGNDIWNKFTGAGVSNLTEGRIGFTEALGSGQAHNNLPPYRAVYMWYRSA